MGGERALTFRGGRGRCCCCAVPWWCMLGADAECGSPVGIGLDADAVIVIVLLLSGVRVVITETVLRGGEVER